MARKYIKNCTGSSGKKKSSAKTSAFSKALSRIIFHVLLWGFFAVSIYILFFSEYLKVNNISITGTQELSSSDIQKSLEEHFQGKFFNVIPKNNFLFVYQKRTADFLEGNFKKIRAVTVSKKFPDAVSINIDERKAVLVWCSGENCFLIDENGIAYNIADFESPEIVQNHLLRINDASARDVAIGEKITSSSYEQYVVGIKDALKGIDQETSDEAYSSPSNMADEIDVKITTGAQVYFSTQFPLDSAIYSLNIVLKKEIPQEKIGDIDYIDLRSEGRVFYKFKNTEEPAENKSENNSIQTETKKL